MFFAIIPLSHSLGTEPLIYSCANLGNRELHIGSLVEIPYGNNQEIGIVAGKIQQLPFGVDSEEYLRIKGIIKIITEVPLLAEYQVHMIISISKRYMIPIHRVVGFFLSKPILNRLEKKTYTQIQEIKNTNKSSQKLYNIHILKDDIVRPSLVKSYINGPTIVIVADDFALMPYIEQYRDTPNVLFFSNEMTDTKKAQAWIDIKNGVFPIIYGTRKILYYNLEKYQNIIYIEDSLGKEYWHYPIKIKYIEILSIFHESYKETSLQILTSVPSISLLHQFRKFDIKNITTELS